MKDFCDLLTVSNEHWFLLVASLDLELLSHISCPACTNETGAENDAILILQFCYILTTKRCRTPTWRRAKTALKQLHATNRRGRYPRCVAGRARPGVLARNHRGPAAVIANTPPPPYITRPIAKRCRQRRCSQPETKLYRRRPPRLIARSLGRTR